MADNYLTPMSMTRKWDEADLSRTYTLNFSENVIHRHWLAVYILKKGYDNVCRLDRQQ